MGLRFEWDKNKAQANLKKHGVSFDEAVTVFDDPLARIFYDEDHSEDEAREIIVGQSKRNRLLMVCFIERVVDVVRIISARLATKQEREDYEENAKRQTSG
jgi:uncharacterized DUF497 family protein